MDEEQEKYHRRLKIRNYIMLADIYILAFSMLAIPLSHFDYGVIALVTMYAPAISVVVWLVAPRLLLKSSGFWYSTALTAKADFVLVVGTAILMPAYAVSMLLAIYLSMPDFLMASPQLIIGALFISVMGPLLYAVRKWKMKKYSKKYGETRGITLKMDKSRAKELVETALKNMKLQYNEGKEGSKMEGFRDSYILDSGLRIIIVPISTIKSSIRIANIPDDDTLEKQIEGEILRRLSTSQL